MKQLVLAFFLLCISLAFGLECVNCGVFLSAPTSQCRGKVSKTSCAPENVGCLTITGQNQDGTYYVEKRCAFKSEDREEGCGEILIRGNKAMGCVCKTDYCNKSNSFDLLFTSAIILSLFIASI